jgi:uncharacterized protein YllA (UPF0747 family)
LTASAGLCDSTSLVHSQSASSSDSALRLAVDIRRLPWMRRLAVDYAFDHDRVADFFSGNPADPAAWDRAIRAARDHGRERGDVAALVVAQHERRGAPPDAVIAAGLLADPRSVAIVTGQQAGLLGGPLFTFLKALTTIRLARRIRDEYGVPVVPVFWIDAEDHDWDEVRSCGVLDGDLALREIGAPAPEGAGERPVGSLRWPAEIEATIARLGETLPATEFTAWTLEVARHAYAPGRTAA